MPMAGLLAAVGATVVDIEIEGHGPDRVVGFGAAIVRRDVRGRGIGTMLVDRVVELAKRLGPDRAMMFCEPHLVALYVSRGYLQIDAEVWVEQPDGELLMPLTSM
jgi:GNAT superfamily N-acetyltransferase